MVFHMKILSSLVVDLEGGGNFVVVSRIALMYRMSFVGLWWQILKGRLDLLYNLGRGYL